MGRTSFALLNSDRIRFVPRTRVGDPAARYRDSMSWQLVAGLNLLIAGCYVVISALIVTGLVRTRQLWSNKLGLATAMIFATCALHHWAHALHLLIPEGGGGRAGLEATRQTFDGSHNIAVEVLGAGVALTYLGLRRNYRALLSTPAMFDDAVRAAAEQRLRVMAFTDQLTEVPNRAAYQAYADSLRGDPRPVAVLFADLDGFKQINDSQGHEAGDRLLREVAQRMLTGLRPAERLFRVGGDEFVVVGVGLAEAEADDLRDRVEWLVSAPFVTREGAVSVRASIGTSWDANGNQVDRLVREADVEMYRVKAARGASES
jgi:diguanylate cyclase (GGDEF)-like protein